MSGKGSRSTRTLECIELADKIPEETIDIIATDIFEIEKVEEIEKYF